MYIGKLSDRDYRIGKYITIGICDKISKSSFSYFHLESNHVQLEDTPTDKMETFYTTLTCKFGKLFSIRFLLPSIIKPIVFKTKANWSEETTKRLGRDWYYEYRNRCYGFTMDKDHINFKCGLTINEFGFFVERSKYINFPWAVGTYINSEFYDSENKICVSHPTVLARNVEGIQRTYATIRDFDGEVVEASFSKVVRVYYRFSGSLLWLAKLLPKKRYASLEVNFNKETGGQKGSWKGGTIGSSSPMKFKDTAIDALKNYCDERKMTIIAITGTGYDDVRVKVKEDSELQKEKAVEALSVVSTDKEI